MFHDRSELRMAPSHQPTARGSFAEEIPEEDHSMEVQACTPHEAYAIMAIYCGMAQRQRRSLISFRSRVRVPLPLPKKIPQREGWPNPGDPGIVERSKVKLDTTGIGSSAGGCEGTQRETNPEGLRYWGRSPEGSFGGCL